MSALTAVHVAALWSAAALTLALLAVIVLGVATSRRRAVALDRCLLALLVALAVGAVTGLALLAGGNGPADALHLLYAAAAPLILAVARWRAGRVSARRAAVWLASGAVLTLGVLLRLWTTG